MASLQRRRWRGDAAGLSRRDRRPCDYEVYLPDAVSGRRFSLDGDAAADASDAEAALVRFDASASALIGRSFQATGQAIDRLAQAGALSQITVGRRNRAYESPELIDAFTALERRLASAEGDTRVSQPRRRVPRRPQD